MKTEGGTILIIDDEEKLRSLAARILRFEGHVVLEAADAKAARRLLEEKEVEVVLCDVKLPDANGVELVREIKVKYPALEIIMFTAYGNIPDGVQAIKNGAFDYIIKGDDNNKLVPLIGRALEKVALTGRVRELEAALAKHTKDYTFDSLIGDSDALRQAVGLARKVAQTHTTVFLTGETGTGKEVFAHAIHKAGSRAMQPFVAINCSAFGRELLESELFGYKAGAFTGAATKDKKGLFEEADKGTIFLDELGEMPIDLQAKLLRVLETGEFLKVGDSKPTRVDVRLIAATNRDLQAEIQNGHFREDLYYRISVFEIRLPSLRERKADVALLAQHFLRLFAHKTNKKINRINGDCLHALELHAWKGNIRELKNVVERAVILCEGNTLSLQDLPHDFQHLTQPTPSPLSAFSLASVEKLHIQKVLNHTNGNKTKTAELLGIALTTLYRKLEEYKLNP